MSMKYFCFYHDYLTKLAMLEDAQAGRVVKAAALYAATGRVTDFEKMEGLMYQVMKDDIDRQQKEYDEKCERNRRNILKRYQKPTTVYDGMQEEDEEEYENKYEYEYKDKEKEKYEYDYKDENEEKEEGEDTFVPPTLLDVLNYCRESGLDTDVDMFLEYYDANDWRNKSGKPIRSWKKALRMWQMRQKRYDG